MSARTSSEEGRRLGEDVGEAEGEAGGGPEDAQGRLPLPVVQGREESVEAREAPPGPGGVVLANGLLKEALVQATGSTVGRHLNLQAGCKVGG